MSASPNTKKRSRNDLNQYEKNPNNSNQNPIATIGTSISNEEYPTITHQNQHEASSNGNHHDPNNIFPTNPILPSIYESNGHQISNLYHSANRAVLSGPNMRHNQNNYGLNMNDYHYNNYNQYILQNQYMNHHRYVNYNQNANNDKFFHSSGNIHHGEPSNKHNIMVILV